MKGIKLSSWIVVESHCATRIIDGTDPDVVANRVAFIEKTPRVRIAPFTTFEEEQGKWTQGPKGTGGPFDDNHEDLGQYGFNPESRAWCDNELKTLGYII